MNLRDWAIRILSADTIEEKLFTPDTLNDESPGPAIFWDEPTRPIGMGFTKRKKEDKLPHFESHHNAENRAICLHRFCGHELLAVEIMAYALLAFPNASKSFRKGLAHTLKEEQEHVRLYSQRLQEMGVTFGDLPLYRHFWAHTPDISSPLRYVSIMSLTLEMANLDFAPIYKKSFDRVGDLKSSALMQRIWDDEVSHVRFGWQWLKQFCPEGQSAWETWTESLMPTLLCPKRAKGFYLHEEPRRKAGLPDEWIEGIRNS